MASFLSSLLKLLSVILTCCSSSCIGATLGLDDQLLQLKRENEVFSLKFVEMEARLTKLETLEQELKELKSQLILEQTNKSILKINAVEEDKTPSIQSMAKSAIFRTCRETRAADPSLTSGMHWIDPDGQGVGDDPIYVYCDMISGSTLVLHDSETQMSVGHCSEPGCYSRTIIYNSSMRQMTALAELSNQCQQSIRYDCNFAPFEMGGITYAWWNDKNGDSQNFWSGNNSTVHTCQCGIDHNCAEDNMLCNCDSGAPIPLNDDGVITDKNLLPITGLNFGRTQLESSSGVHTLGRFVCSGQVAVNGMPSSCVDLWRTGHTLSGLYSIMGTNMVETVYCDFAKLPNEPSFQTWIGYADVKTSPTYFYVQRNSSLSTASVVSFQVERLNVGGGMNLTSGTFTVTRPGTYQFLLSGSAYFSVAGSKGIFAIDLVLNGGRIADAHIQDVGTEYIPYSLQSTLNLKAGDKVWLYLRAADKSILHDDGFHYTHFSGFLLQEDISGSRNIL